MTSFILSVTYGQISVFNPKLENPFNDWSQKNYDQGFSWRSKSVSFTTLIDSGKIDVEVDEAKDIKKISGMRAISVPFVVEDNNIEIASISDSKVIAIAPGKYQLVYETGLDGDRYWSHFKFILNGDMEPKNFITG